MLSSWLLTRPPPKKPGRPPRRVAHLIRPDYGVRGAPHPFADPIKRRIKQPCEIAARKRLGLDDQGCRVDTESHQEPEILDAAQLDHLRRLEQRRDRHAAQADRKPRRTELPFGKARSST
jgi:hypothetical protein